MSEQAKLEMKGHLLDSLTLPKALDSILSFGCDYELETLSIGKSVQDQSHVVLTIKAQSLKTLESALDRLYQMGAVRIDNQEAKLAKAHKDGVFPDQFYASTNYETDVMIHGDWHRVQGLSMDSGICWDESNQTAFALKMREVKTGMLIVVNTQGVRVNLPASTSSKSSFGFMESGASTEKPRQAMVKAVADALIAAKQEAKGEIVIVAGPAIVHTGAAPQLARLIEMGFVDFLFAGNALAVHDVEACLYGTSLGIDLETGDSRIGGHRYHLYAINQIRKVGGLKQAVQQGMITHGVMHALITQDKDFLLAGSIRDDGPLPEVITDALEVQDRLKPRLQKARMVIMLSTMLHSIAVGNLLPARVKTVCVDVLPQVVTKLADRGTRQATGLVMDVHAFLSELVGLLEKSEIDR